MGIRCLAFAMLGALQACTSSTPAVTALPPEAPVALELDEVLPFSARAILDLIDSSPQDYSIAFNPALKPYDLKAGGEEIDYGRLRFSFALRFSPQGVAMEFADSGASSLVLASCLAAWEREHSLEAYRKRDFAQVRLRHCLLNQALAAQALQEQGYPLDRGSRDLVKALENGTMGSLLLWEVLATPYPQVMYLVSDQDRAEVLRYLDLSVVRRKRL